MTLRRPARVPATGLLALLVVAAGVFACDAGAAVPEERDSGYRWRLCPAGRFIPLKPGYTESSTDPDATEIRADSTRLVKGGLSQFSGDVEVIRGKQAIRADLVTYDSERDTFDAEGRAHIWDSGVTWSGERATYNLDTEFSVLENGRYWLQNGRGRGNADRLSHDPGPDVTVLEGVDYSTCPLSDEAWRIEASNIRLDHKADRGSARNAVLRIRDVPVFYFPYVNFPISDKRKTGFLAPSIGTTNESGFDLRVPFYVNIAPNQDATITPRILSDRGTMIGGEYRYMRSNYRGRFQAEYLPGDDLFGQDRSAVSFDHSHRFHRNRGRIYALFNNVSDDQYFEDFGRSLSVTSQRFLDRRIDLDYRHRNFIVDGIVQSYQTIDDTLAPGVGPYRRLPQIRFRGWSSSRYFGMRPTLSAEASYFDRAASVTAGRLDFEPAIDFRFQKSYLDIEPKLALRHTEYFIDDPNRVFDDRENRTVPILSVDSKVFMERRLDWFGRSSLQTFEPRVFYLLIPHIGQEDIPRFDGGLFDISFRNLFRPNRFTGRDRIGDANQVAVAATTRMLDTESGRETYRFSLGQIFYFRDRKVTLPTGVEDDDSVSEIIAEAAVGLGYDFDARGTLQWDPGDSKTEKAALSLRYRPDLDTVVNLSYRLRRAISEIEQTDFSFRWPLSDRLAAVGRWNYSIQDSRSLETVGGLEYESCCWGARIVGRRFLRNASGAYDTGVFMQVHLKGLGGIGQKTESFLRRGIPGYEDPFQ